MTNDKLFTINSVQNQLNRFSFIGDHRSESSMDRREAFKKKKTTQNKTRTHNKFLKYWVNEQLSHRSNTIQTKC